MKRLFARLIALTGLVMMASALAGCGYNTIPT